MLKSDYIREQNEHELLRRGYLRTEFSHGVQTWADIQQQGLDIYHCVYQYPIFVEESGFLSPQEVTAAGGFYFMVASAPQIILKTASVEEAIKASRSQPI